MIEAGLGIMKMGRYLLRVFLPNFCPAIKQLTESFTYVTILKFNSIQKKTEYYHIANRIFLTGRFAKK